MIYTTHAYILYTCVYTLLYHRSNPDRDNLRKISSNTLRQPPVIRTVWFIWGTPCRRRTSLPLEVARRGVDFGVPVGRRNGVREPEPNGRWDRGAQFSLGTL